MMNWRQIYGDAEFALHPPVYWSDIVRRRNRRNVDLDDLKQKAEAYARGQCTENSVDYGEMIKGENEIKWPPMKKEVDLEARVERDGRDERKKLTQLKTETTLIGGGGTTTSTSTAITPPVATTALGPLHTN